jgi:hypothetical protein
MQFRTTLENVHVSSGKADRPPRLMAREPAWRLSAASMSAIIDAYKARRSAFIPEERD